MNRSHIETQLTLCGKNQFAAQEFIAYAVAKFWSKKGRVVRTHIGKAYPFEVKSSTLNGLPL